MKHRFLASPFYKGIIFPLAQMLAFIIGTGTVLSMIVLILAFVLKGSAIDQAAVSKNGMDFLGFFPSVATLEINRVWLF